MKREFPGRTIIGSGDIHTAPDALRMIEQTGVDGVLAARGAIGNPWLFRQARDLAAGREPSSPDLDEQREVIARHFRLASDIYGPRRGLQIMRNFGIHYARLHPHPAKVRMAFISVKNERDWRAVMETWYARWKRERTLRLNTGETAQLEICYDNPLYEAHEYDHHGQEPDQELRQPHRRRRDLLRDPGGRVLRLPGAERRRARPRPSG